MDMDSTKLTHEQADKLHRALWPLANYLIRLRDRMHAKRFPPTDSLYVAVRDAQTAVRGLMTNLHYLSCKSGVGNPGWPKPGQPTRRDSATGAEDEGRPGDSG
jgi:hypothetical protein